MKALTRKLVRDLAAMRGQALAIALVVAAGRPAADGPAEAVLPAFTAEMAHIGEADADADLAG